MKTARISLLMTPELRGEVFRLAQLRGLTVNEMVCRLLKTETESQREVLESFEAYLKKNSKAE